MKKNKRKAFTLVEVLATIAILAMILMIAIPVIIGVIDEAKRDSFKNSILGIFGVVELEYSSTGKVEGNVVDLSLNNKEQFLTGNWEYDPDTGDTTLTQVCNGEYKLESLENPNDMFLVLKDDGTCSFNIIIKGNNPDSVACSSVDQYVDQGAYYGKTELFSNDRIDLRYAGNYKLGYSYDTVYAERIVTVTNNHVPTLSISETKVIISSTNTTFDPMDYVTEASDPCEGDIKRYLTDSDLHNGKMVSDVILGVPGTYHVTYEVINKGGHKKTAALEVVVQDHELVVNGNNPDTVNCHPTNKYSDAGATYNFDKNITVYADPLSLKHAGEYRLQYSYDLNGTPLVSSRTVNITNDKAPSIILTTNKVVLSSVVSDFDARTYVKSVTDACEGDINAYLYDSDISNGTVTSNVVLGVVGNYSVIYEVVNKGGNRTTVTLPVEIKQAQLVVNGNNPDTISCKATGNYDDQGATYNFDDQMTVYGNVLPLKYAGRYILDYMKVVNGKTLEANRTVNITNANVPTIGLTTEKVTLSSVESQFDPMDYVESVTDLCEGDIKSYLTDTDLTNGKITSNVVPRTVGTYQVIYEVINKGGTKKSVTLPVEVKQAQLVVKGNNPDTVSCHITNTYIDQGATYNFDSSVIAYASPLSLKNAGQYRLQYSKVLNGKTLATSRVVNITNTNTPVITLKENKVIISSTNTTFDPMDYVESVIDPCEGDIKSYITDTDTNNGKMTSNVILGVVGTYTVNYEVVNKGGKKGVATLTVEVKANELIVKGNNPDTVSCHATNKYTDQGAYYNFDTNIVVYADPLPLKNAGEYRIQYSYDLNGTALTTSRTVNITNTNTPTITLSTSSVTIGTSQTSFDPINYVTSATDPCEGDIKRYLTDTDVSNGKTTSNVVVQVVGTYTVTYSITNKGGKTTTKTLSVSVVDDTKPTISSVTGNPSAWTNGNVTLTVNATDNVGVTHYSFDGGTTWQTANAKQFTSNQTVNIKVKDAAGNVSNGSSVVISKIDKELPTISGLTDLVINKGASVSLTSGVTASDTGGSGLKGTYTYTPIDTSGLGVGVGTITYRAEDNAGNVYQATRKITVNNPLPPPDSDYVYDSSYTTDTTVTIAADGWYRFYVIGRGGNGGNGGPNCSSGTCYRGGGGGGGTGAIAIHELYMTKGQTLTITFTGSATQLVVNGTTVTATNGGAGATATGTTGAGSGGAGGTASGGNKANYNGFGGGYGVEGSNENYTDYDCNGDDRYTDTFYGFHGGKGGDGGTTGTPIKYFNSINGTTLVSVSNRGGGPGSEAGYWRPTTCGKEYGSDGDPGGSPAASYSGLPLFGNAGGGGGGLTRYSSGSRKSGVGGTGATGGVVIDRYTS